MYHRFVITALLVFAGSAVAQDFSYDKTQPLKIETSVAVAALGHRRPGAAAATQEPILVQHLSYASPKGGRVPATLVTPRGVKSPAAIIFMHWGLGDRYAFLDEAITLGHSGVTSLLIDAPFVRPGAKEQSELDEVVQTVIDLRRAVDLLQSKSSIRHQIGFVGLSYGAWMGAILSGVEPRIECFVLAGGLASNSDEQKNASLAPLDAEKWIARKNVPVFLQFALKDEYISREQVARWDKATPDPRLLKWYEGGHEFNPASRRDRMSWLSTIFGFTLPDATYQSVALPDKPLAMFNPYEEIAKQGVVIDIPGMQHAVVKRDIAWKGDLKMDIYYPHGVVPDDRIPAIISLAGQAPPDFMRTVRHMRFSTTFAQALATRCNRIVVVPDLKSAHTATARYGRLQEVATDVDDLIAYVRSHADELQIDRDSLGILFRSAGWSYGFRAALRGAPTYVKAVVAYYPHLAIDALPGLPQQFLDELSPLKLFAQGKPLPPILLVTPQYDDWSSAADTKRFLDAAATAKTIVRHIHLPNGGHAFELDDDLEESREALLQTMLFLREKLPIRRR